MIPVKLTMRNFMPYRDNVPPLDFSGIHTATISGDNGNGKSAIIDAMTWALWGKTRAKSDDDLIHLGQTEMEVEFDFTVGNQTYRIIRKHAKPKRQRASGQSSLDLFISNDGLFRPVSGNTIRETEQKIRDTLHMDYDTFVNSAYLRQGHADEFTQQAPAKRKEVLANILGLSFYDELETKARDAAKANEDEKTIAERSIQDMNAELERKPVYVTELAQAEEELSKIEKTTGEQESAVNGLRQQRETLKGKQSQLAQLEEHLKKSKEDLKRWNENIEQRQKVIQEYEELIGRREAIENGYKQFTEAKKLNDELNRKLTLVNKLSQNIYQMETAINAASQNLSKEHALIENKIADLEAKSQKLPALKTELQKIQLHLQQLAAGEETLRQKRQTAQELKARLHSLENDKARLENELTDIDEKLKLLTTETGARCPVCETVLGEENLKIIIDKYNKDKNKNTELLKTNKVESIQIQKDLVKLDSETTQLEAKLNLEKATAQGKAGRLGQEISEAEKAGDQLSEAKTRLAEIEERMAKRDFAIAEQQLLSQLQGELAGLDYEPQQHEKARLELAGLEQYEKPKQRLEEAETRIDQEREAVARSEESAKDLRQSMAADEQKKLALVVETKSMPNIEADLALAEAAYRQLGAKQKQAQETVGNIKARLERCVELETKKKEREAQANKAAAEAQIYEDLSRAFGKNGIQALLIEMALPEIEIETNRLLGRMTDNRMTVKIETQRETKKGDVIETLDIKIGDELGTRNYEMFSGGEAFRINFAIRIALSKLLAKRAGAPLRTLIIDEGFGTQDTNGLEKLKEAIISIQDDFDRIFVITHIDEFRDAFPTRIDVLKTAEGSTIEVS